MDVKSIDMVWIVVKDLKEAIKFYSEVVGLKLMELHEQFGWAELEGHSGGSRLGLAQASYNGDMKAGQNAFVTFTVENLEVAKSRVAAQGAQCVGDVQEIPGHVKLQMVADRDGNQFQLVEVLH